MGAACKPGSASRCTRDLWHIENNLYLVFNLVFQCPKARKSWRASFMQPWAGYDTGLPLGTFSSVAKRVLCFAPGSWSAALGAGWRVLL